MPTFEKPKPAERRSVLVNLLMTRSQVEAVDRIARALGLSARADVLRAGLEALLKQDPTAAAAAAAEREPEPDQFSEGSEPGS